MVCVCLSGMNGLLTLVEHSPLLLLLPISFKYGFAYLVDVRGFGGELNAGQEAEGQDVCG